MARQVINKIISLVLVSSLLIGNICTYVEARDFKLSFIYMLDAIEDMEYKDRESVYESEHLSFLSKDESNSESSVACSCLCSCACSRISWLNIIWCCIVSGNCIVKLSFAGF